jgi:hypothetical protein
VKISATVLKCLAVISVVAQSLVAVHLSSYFP